MLRGILGVYIGDNIGFRVQGLNFNNGESNGTEHGT